MNVDRTLVRYSSRRSEWGRVEVRFRGKEKSRRCGVAPEEKYINIDSSDYSYNYYAKTIH